MKWLFLIVALLVVNSPSQGEEPVKRNFSGKDLEKVGGTYKVASVRRVGEQYFEIKFESEAKTGKHDVLLLVSDHMHIGVEKGMKLRLSAEVLAKRGNVTEVSQVLLFLPRGETHVPVWMLSRNVRGHDLRGAKYIEMHAPTSDYQIF